MIKARPNINGNTANDFQTVVDKFTDAMVAVNDARRALFGDVLNGRNYQHLAAPFSVLAADRTTYFETLVALSDTLDSIRTDIHKAMNGGEE